MIVRIAERKGIGDILAEGSERAAAHFGKGADKYSICCKGQEFPAHMPRVKASLALAYACNPFGADHQSSQHDPAISALPFDEDMATLGFRVPVPSDSLGFEKVRLWAYTQQLSALSTHSNYANSVSGQGCCMESQILWSL